MIKRLLEFLRRLTEPDAASAQAASAERKNAMLAEVYALGGGVTEAVMSGAHPRDLRRIQDYVRGVRLLGDPTFALDEVVTFALGDNPVLGLFALEALRERSDARGAVPRLLRAMDELSNWQRWLLCELLEERHPEPVLEPFLAGLDRSWESPMARTVLKDFLERRLRRGETIEAGWLASEAPASAPVLPFAMEAWNKAQFLVSILDQVERAEVQELARRLRQALRSGADLAKLRAFARVLDSDEGPPILTHEAFVAAAGRAEADLLRGRGVLVCGRSGSGRSTLIRELSRRLRERGHLVFEASPGDVLAGQGIIGELEKRLNGILEIASRVPVVWIVPSFLSLIWAGRTMQSADGLLERIMPHLEAGRLRLLAEIEPAGLERLLREQPRLRGTIEVVQLAPLPAEVTLALLRRWAQPATGGEPLASEAVLAEALELAQHFLGQIDLPGSVLGLLRTALEARQDAAAALTPADLMSALGRLTGLPAVMLDERQTLDLAALRQLFDRRVLGQHEAVECLVQRVAMLKAGLVDPGRPAGVFLFTGPTGTGKTEIARTLAEFLFGSPERLVRVDMSELVGPMAQARLLGGPDATSGAPALVHRLREQPFAVVLLDEFEKADPSIWDVFLQVFDAGRLTDAQGRTADFRHAIFLLTSNLGACNLTDSGLGFGSARSGLENVHAELARAFRPEFLNRLDRVVVFRPLSRPVMRQVLQKELARVLELRGLRTRQWVIEWDESALDFLLEKGFSETLGARPLRRAIEQWFLAPLATTIVNREAPSGDQFLFVRSDGRRIEVVFVDPDAPEPAPDDVVVPAAPPPGLDVGALSLDGGGSPGEIAFLQEVLERLEASVQDEAWTRAREAALARLEEPGFWEQPARFAVLSEVEYRDRILAGLASARRLLDRLTGSRRPRVGRRRTAPEVVRQLAQQLYLLEAALETLAGEHPRDAFVSVEVHDDGPAGGLDPTFGWRIADMYRSWAARRRMRIEEFTEPSATGPWRWTAAISGYGAYLLLEPEVGWHVLEVEGPHGTTHRHRVRVRLAPQPEYPQEDTRAALLAAFSGDGAPDPRIVRRYRESPSPLVRDAVRGWRTGRLDRVLAGDFDLVR
jgi:ATP-dependent Clp protease ATP-binding subunit ClpC